MERRPRQVKSAGSFSREDEFNTTTLMINSDQVYCQSADTLPAFCLSVSYELPIEKPHVPDRRKQIHKFSLPECHEMIPLRIGKVVSCISIAQFTTNICVMKDARFSEKFEKIKLGLFYATYAVYKPYDIRPLSREDPSIPLRAVKRI